MAAPLSRLLAALLACPGGVASHRTAAVLWQLLPGTPAGEPVDVTVPPTCHRGRRPGIRAHRASLTADEFTLLDGLPLTSPTRTLIDLGGLVTTRELERALAQAERAGQVRPRELRSVLDRHPHRQGTRQLRQLLNRDARPVLTRSEAEDRLLALIRAAGLPEPDFNVLVQGFEVDCFWKLARLAVEVDGYAYHTSARAFLRDRQRDSALAAAGIQVLRLTWHQLEREREKTLVQLAQALARALP